MKVTKTQLKQIIKEEMTKVLSESAGSFTYNVLEDEDDGGPTVEIEGINKTFKDMILELEGQELPDDEPPFETFTFKLENFRRHEEQDLDDLLANIIVEGAPDFYIESWAEMNGYEAQKTGAYY